MSSSTPVTQGNKTIRDSRPTVVQRLATIPAVEGVRTQGPEVVASPAARLDTARRIVEATQRGVAAADAAKLAELRGAIESGKFRLDAAELAERLLSDSVDDFVG